MLLVPIPNPRVIRPEHLKGEIQFQAGIDLIQYCIDFFVQRIFKILVVYAGKAQLLHRPFHFPPLQGEGGLRAGLLPCGYLLDNLFHLLIDPQLYPAELPTCHRGDCGRKSRNSQGQDHHQRQEY